METKQGSLEFIALELTRVMSPLKDELLDGRAISFFAELGIFITKAQQQVISPACYIQLLNYYFLHTLSPNEKRCRCLQ